VTTTRAAVAVSFALALAACSKDDHPKTYEVPTRFTATPPPSALAAPTASGSAHALTGDQALLLDSAGMRAAGEQLRWAPPPSTSASASPTAAPSPRPAPTADPDQPILASTHDALGRCFSSLRAGPGAGPPALDTRVQLTVLDTGSVLRTEVPSSDVDDPAILDCLQRTGNMARFSDNDGGPLRTYTIDVRLVAH
jgi:hypothetical protein